MKLRYILYLAVFLQLTACTTSPERKPVSNPEVTWQQRQHELASINDWHVTGRAAIINGHESWHLNITWEKHDDKYILDLSGPLGTGRSQLSGTSSGVQLVDSDQNAYYASNPDQLLYERAGFRMPVSDLLYWMKGLPHPDLEHEKQKIDEYGRLAQLMQDGWRVRFRSYMSVGKKELPQKIFIDGYNLKVKIFIDEWDLTSKTFTLVKN